MINLYVFRELKSILKNILGSISNLLKIIVTIKNDHQ